MPSNRALSGLPDARTVHQAAKNELLEATSDEDVDRAIRKVSILCDD